MEVALGRIKDGFKVCPQCGENKDVESGYYKCGSHQKCMSWCKACCKRLRPAKPEYFKQYYQKNKVRCKFNDLKRHYGITLEQYNAIFMSQKGKCDICKKVLTSGKQGTHVDHDHNFEINCFKFVRGLLCGDCNRLLGAAKDSIGILLSAVEYLKKSNPTS